MTTNLRAIDVSGMSVDYCKECGEGHHLVNGLCRDCRQLVVHPTYVATIYGTPAMHKKSARCPICRGDGPGEE